MRIDDVPVPRPKEGWSIVAPIWAGICGTDIKQYLYGPIGLPVDPHPVSGASIPITLGHEFMGLVIETSAVDGSLSVGDRVVADAAIRCGTCWYCLNAGYILCDQGAILGITADGGLAEQVAVPNYALYRLPASVSDDVGAVIEPLAVAMHTVRRTNLRPGDHVLIVGGGMIGLSCLLIARAAGAGSVVVIEPLAERRELASTLGAARTIDPTVEGGFDPIHAVTRGMGADVGIDCVGSETTLRFAIDGTRKGGTVGLVGTHTREPSLDVNAITASEKTLVGVCAYNYDFARVVDLLADWRVDPSPLITDRIRLDQIIGDGFRALVEHPREHIKVLVDVRRH